MTQPPTHIRINTQREHTLRLEGVGKTAVETGRTRLVFTGGLFVLAFLLVAVQLVSVSFRSEGPQFARRTISSDVIGQTVRADITDRNGVLLATNLPTVNLYADSRIIQNPKDVARQLAKILPDLDVKKTEEHLSSGSAFTYIHRNLTPAQQYDVNQLGYPGLSFEDADVRLYPQGRLFAHILGKTDIDNRGISGLEKHFDAELKNGKPLRLSVDVRAQSAATEAARNAMETYKATAASAVVQNVHTGEIVAMVSLPDFDPNHTETMTSENMFNHASLGVYELGSVFKIFNTAIALESGKVQVYDRFDTTEPLRIARRTIRDTHPVKYKMSVPEILARSSNIGSVQIALDVGGPTQREFLERFGLMRRASIEIPEVGRPTIPAGPWQPITIATVSYGHGIAVSPVQAVTATSAVVNGGVLHEATLIAKPKGSVPEGKRVISEKTSHIMRQLMRMVVTDGTGGKADVAGYRVGGKTGTANKVVDGKYSRRKVLTSFLGMFPADDPQYAILVTLDEPRGIPATAHFINAGWNAAPMAGNIVKAIGPMLGVEPGIDPFFDAEDAGPYVMASVKQ